MALTHTAALWGGVGGPAASEGRGDENAEQLPESEEEGAGHIPLAHLTMPLHWAVPDMPPPCSPVRVSCFIPVTLKAHWFLGHKLEIRDEFLIF